MCEQEIARLWKDNYPTIDSAMRLQRLHLFQMTVSSTHGVNITGLDTALRQLGAPIAPDFALLYFVVPPDVFSKFNNPTAEDGEFPDNVQMAVLEIPLPSAWTQTQGARPGVDHV